MRAAGGRGLLPRGVEISEDAGDPVIRAVVYGRCAFPFAGRQRLVVQFFEALIETPVQPLNAELILLPDVARTAVPVGIYGPRAGNLMNSARERANDLVGADIGLLWIGRD